MATIEESNSKLGEEVDAAADYAKKKLAKKASEGAAAVFQKLPTGCKIACCCCTALAIPLFLILVLISSLGFNTFGDADDNGDGTIDGVYSEQSKYMLELSNELDNVFLGGYEGAIDAAQKDVQTLDSVLYDNKAKHKKIKLCGPNNCGRSFVAGQTNEEKSNNFAEYLIIQEENKSSFVCDVPFIIAAYTFSKERAYEKEHEGEEMKVVSITDDSNFTIGMGKSAKSARKEIEEQMKNYTVFSYERAETEKKYKVYVVKKIETPEHDESETDLETGEEILVHYPKKVEYKRDKTMKEVDGKFYTYQIIFPDMEIAVCDAYNITDDFIDDVYERATAINELLREVYGKDYYAGADGLGRGQDIIFSEDPGNGKTNWGFIEYAKVACTYNPDSTAEYGYDTAGRWGYIYATYGQIATESICKWGWTQDHYKIGSPGPYYHWQGRHVTDCIGLFKGYSWYHPEIVGKKGGGFIVGTPENQKKYPELNLQYRYYGVGGFFGYCNKKGMVSYTANMKESNLVPGVALIVQNRSHIGVYAGYNEKTKKYEVIHASGTRVGVKKSSYSSIKAMAKSFFYCTPSPYLVYMKNPPGTLTANDEPTNVVTQQVKN